VTRRSGAAWLALAVACAAVVSLSAQGGVRRVALVVTNGTVVTMDSGGRVLQNGAVAIDGSDIVAVDTAAAVARQFLWPLSK
jgi:hypothetical protein